MAWSITGKTVVVTGASSGVGEATAIALARLGANLAVIARDPKRGEASLAKVRAAGDPDARLFLADLALLGDVRRLAAELDAALPRLDVLINNAGAVFMKREVTAEGFERTFALNHLAYFLLTKLLLPKLAKSAPARIINVSSEAHRLNARLDFDDLQSTKNYGGLWVYGGTKLANLLFTRELAKRLTGTEVTVNAMHPGTVATGFGHNNDKAFGVVMKLITPFMRTPEKAAKTAVYLATAPELAAVSGEYFSDSKRKATNARARSDADAARLWLLSEELTNTAEPPPASRPNVGQRIQSPGL